jgi:NAD+ synthase
VGALGCASELVDISTVVDAYFDGQPTASAVRRGNFMARVRMAVLYDRSVTWEALVAGTGNKTEGLLGYTTLHGDSACAFNPIGDLYKSQVRQLAVALGVPEAIIRKPPSADLWPDQTDELEIGVDYPALDRILHARFDEGRSREDVIDLGFDANLVDHVDRLVARSAFKRGLPPVARLAARHAHLDH